MKQLHDSLCNNFKESGLQKVDTSTKIAKLKCSSMLRLYNEDFFE